MCLTDNDNDLLGGVVFIFSPFHFSPSVFLFSPCPLLFFPADPFMFTCMDPRLYDFVR